MGSGDSHHPTLAVAPLLRAAGASLALPAGALALTLLSTLLLTRWLGPAAFGLFALALGWVKALTVPASLGLERIVVREVSRSHVHADWGALRGVLGWAGKLLLGTAASVALGAALLFALATPDPEALNILRLAMALLPLLAIIRLCQYALMGLQRPLVAQLPESLALPLLFLGLLAGFGQIGQIGAGRAILLQLAAGAGAALLAAALLYRSLPDAVRRAAPGGATPAWARSLLPMTLLTGAMAVSAQVPILMLGAMRGPEAAGLMAVTKSLSDLAAVPTIALGTILAPLLGRLWAERDSAGLQRAITLFARKVSVTALPLILALLLLRQPLLELFGAPFAAGADALLILCIGQAASAVAGSNGLLLTMTGHERTVAAVSVACLAANVGLCATLIPSFGLEGAAAASAGSLLIWNLWLAFCSRNLLGVRPSAFAQLA